MKSIMLEFKIRLNTKICNKPGEDGARKETQAHGAREAKRTTLEFYIVPAATTSGQSDIVCPWLTTSDSNQPATNRSITDIVSQIASSNLYRLFQPI